MNENLKEKNAEKNNTSDLPENDLTIEKLKELIGDQTLSDEKAREIIIGINTLVSIIINYQQEQEANNNEEEFNLNQAA